MELNETQKQQIIQWVQDGDSIAEVQRKIDEEFHLRMTYMDVRFLIEDLEVKLVDREPSPEEKAESLKQGESPDPGAAPADAGDDWEKGASNGSVSVSVDPVTRPGTVVSGKVTFSDGENAEWQLDQMGRLGLIPTTKGYQPPPDDIEAFQRSLQDELQKKGF